MGSGCVAGSVSKDYNYFIILFLSTLDVVWRPLLIFGTHDLIAYTLLKSKISFQLIEADVKLARATKVRKTKLLNSINDILPRCLYPE